MERTTERLSNTRTRLQSHRGTLGLGLELPRWGVLTPRPLTSGPIRNCRKPLPFSTSLQCPLLRKFTIVLPLRRKVSRSSVGYHRACILKGAFRVERQQTDSRHYVILFYSRLRLSLNDQWGVVKKDSGFRTVVDCLQKEPQEFLSICIHAPLQWDFVAFTVKRDSLFLHTLNMG